MRGAEHQSLGVLCNGCFIDKNIDGIWVDACKKENIL